MALSWSDKKGHSVIKRILLAYAFLFPLGCPSEQVVVRDIPGECGNGEIEAQEECDDGNEVATDACTDGCKLSRCGDGITRSLEDPQAEGHEVCDDGNTVDYEPTW